MLKRFFAYYRPHRRLFEDIAWSTGAVAAQPLQRARQIGLEMVVLPSWYDVDDAASLRQLLDHFAASGRDTELLPFAAPATAAYLQRIRPTVDAH